VDVDLPLSTLHTLIALKIRMIGNLHYIIQTTIMYYLLIKSYQ